MVKLYGNSILRLSFLEGKAAELEIVNSKTHEVSFIHVDKNGVFSSNGITPNPKALQRIIELYDKELLQRGI